AVEGFPKGALVGSGMLLFIVAGGTHPGCNAATFRATQRATHTNPLSSNPLCVAAALRPRGRRGCSAAATQQLFVQRIHFPCSGHFFMGPFWGWTMLDGAGRGQRNHGFFHNSLGRNLLIGCIALAHTHRLPHGVSTPSWAENRHPEKVSVQRMAPPAPTPCPPSPYALQARCAPPGLGVRSTAPV